MFKSAFPQSVLRERGRERDRERGREAGGSRVGT